MTTVLKSLLFRNEWKILPANVSQWTTEEPMKLKLGAHYRFEVEAVNKAQLTAKDRTTGVTVDYTPPVVSCII